MPLAWLHELSPYFGVVGSMILGNYARLDTHTTSDIHRHIILSGRLPHLLHEVPKSHSLSIITARAWPLCCNFSFLHHHNKCMSVVASHGEAVSTWSASVHSCQSHYNGRAWGCLTSEFLFFIHFSNWQGNKDTLCPLHKNTSLNLVDFSNYPHFKIKNCKKIDGH